MRGLFGKNSPGNKVIQLSTIGVNHFVVKMANNFLKKDWCFTLNNPALADAVIGDRLKQGGADYVVFQHEVGENGMCESLTFLDRPSLSLVGTHHIQGYVEFTKKKRLAAVKKMLETAHWEGRRGTREQARDYCMKVESRRLVTDVPVELGVWSTKKGDQGKRTDLAMAIELVKEGRGLKRVFEEYPEVFVKHHNGLRSLAGYEVMDRLEPPDVEVYYGPPGCGKTRMARQLEDGETRWDSSIGDGTWFDGYDGQDIAIMDDFDGKFSATKLRDFLKLIDRYAIRVPVKGSFVVWCPRVVRITTNIHPSKWWEWEGREEQLPALFRRFTRVYHWRTDSKDPTVVDRNGRPDMWRRWCDGPGRGRLNVMGPLDNWVLHGTPEHPFDFLEIDM